MNTKILNPIEIRPSQISGYGVFAARAISHGEILEECPVIILSEKIDSLANYIFSWPDNSKETHYSLPLGYGSLYNHSYEPNARWISDTENRKMVFKACRNIEKGEEIFISYGNEWFPMRNLEAIELAQLKRKRFKRYLIRQFYGIGAFVFMILVIKAGIIQIHL